MAESEALSTRLEFVLNGGTDASGDDVTYTFSIGRIDNSISAARIDLLQEKIAACLEYPIASVKKITTELLDDDDE